MYRWMIYIEKQDIQANKPLPKRQIPIDEEDEDEEEEEDK